jgi:HEPN domain-containing protein
VNRADFQILARLRLEEARVLLGNGKQDGAYYLCGYSIECALKACIAKQTQQHDFPPRRAQELYTHDLTRLLRFSELEPLLDSSRAQDPQLEANWATVKDWTEESRYRRHTFDAAMDIYRAVADPAHGVLQWLVRHW